MGKKKAYPTLPQVLKIEEPVFRATVWVVIGGKRNLLLDYLRTIDKRTFTGCATAKPLTDNDACTFVSWEGWLTSVIYIPWFKRKSYSSICHEIAHCVDFYFEHHAIPPGRESSELRAMFSDFLMLAIAEQPRKYLIRDAQ